MANKAWWRKSGPLVIIALLVIAGSTGVYFASNYLFDIRAIMVESDTVQVVIDEQKLPQNLLFFPSTRVAETILKENSLLSSVVIKKKFPHTLVVAVKARVPIARLGLGSTIGLVDKNGVIVGLDDGSKNLPLIELDPEDDGITAALALISALPSEYVIQKITRFDRLSIQAILPKTNIIIAQNIDEQSLSTTLQTILSGFRIKGTMPTRIDLRFDKPVIQL